MGDFRVWRYGNVRCYAILCNAMLSSAMLSSAMIGSVRFLMEQRRVGCPYDEFTPDGRLESWKQRMKVGRGRQALRTV